MANHLNHVFVIMQIGNSDLDRIYHDVIEQAIQACNLLPRRIDKHNHGGLLKSEIDALIKDSAVIIADLTNERPNCYCEIGYAMGLGKSKHLILTAREDHNSTSPSYRPNGARIHFDLAGYEILFWDQNKPFEFQAELEKRIRRCLERISKPRVTDASWQDNWVSDHSSAARSAVRAANCAGYLEAHFDLSQPSQLALAQPTLLKAATGAVIRRPGYWPLGAILAGKCAPQAKADEIVAEIPDAAAAGIGLEIPYTYWALNSRAQFYTLEAYREDLDFRRGSTDNRFLFLDYRLVRATEIILYASRFFQQLRASGIRGLAAPAMARFSLHYVGVKGRLLGNGIHAWKFIPPHPPALEDEVFAQAAETTELLEREIEKWLPSLVQQLTAPLLGLFGFFELEPDEYRDMTQNWRDWLEGRIA
jgi:hypothetical protein